MVVYFNTGTFDVTLTVSDEIETITTTLEDYITASVTPGQASTPSGEEEICTNAGCDSHGS